MYIKSIKLKNFRNYEVLDMDLEPGVNILTGNNAQGKTNILEAVFFCAYGRSHRTSRDRELIKFNTDITEIRCETHRTGNGRTIVIRFNDEGKKFIEINGRKITRMNELLGNLNVVMFSPEDLKVVKESPGVRRRFLDMEICSLDKLYLHDLVNYNKVIAERNNALKSRRPDPMVLDVYDDKASELGARIIGRRLRYIDDLNRKAEDIHREITSGTEKIRFEYRSSVDTVSDIRSSMIKTLKSQRKTDLEKCFTGAGPHRDDFAILINGADARNFGSQGQQRTSILTLKFASLEIIREIIGEYPVLLLDDVLSELDISRQSFILSKISDIQTIITMTGYENIEKRVIENSLIYEINNGESVRVVK